MASGRRYETPSPDANDMSSELKRCANERKFGSWTDLPTGGRCYFLEVPGLHGWTARYVKEVDVEELTIRFLQEIYDENRLLVEVHEKYPVDKGHTRVERGST
jgi:hypothetical protein